MSRDEQARKLLRKHAGCAPHGLGQSVKTTAALRAIIEALRGASGGGVARGTVKDADVDALRYLLNWGDSKSRIRTIMRTVTDDGEATQDRLERLWNALVRPAPDHAAENAKSSGEVRAALDGDHDDLR